MQRLALAALIVFASACRNSGTDTGSDPDVDLDGDGFAGAVDCDDADPTVFPGADEVCNGVDDDCDGTVDLGASDAGVWYGDGDGDGFGDDAAPSEGCVAPAGSASRGGDCDDANPSAWPGAAETCDDTVDLNCDGSAGFVDADGDGVPACEDCDDADPAVSPMATEVCGGGDEDCDGEVDEAGAEGEDAFYPDGDGDGYGRTEGAVLGCAPPEGMVARDGDCDDAQAETSPEGLERCNGADDDCDGETDEADAADATAWYADLDSDGFGDAGSVTVACEAPPGDVADASDCDDLDARSYPGATEICDERDNDCDGVADDEPQGIATWYPDQDGDGFGVVQGAVGACARPEGMVALDTDCDDTQSAIWPGADERCNGADDDCDGETDEPDAVDASAWYLDADGDGVGLQSASSRACAQPDGSVATPGDCDDSNAAAAPGLAEICDGADNDCDGPVDEPDAVDAPTWYADGDADGFGRPGSARRACVQPSGHVDNDDDCDDLRATVKPGGTELCNGRDDDCDGPVDESDAADAPTWHADVDGDGFGDPDASQRACAQPSGHVDDDQDCDDALASVNPDADEVCNNRDDDCDGSVDGPGALDATTWYADADGDSYGDADASRRACAQPSGHVANDDDCDDTNAAIKPGALDRLPNGVDDDCDGLADGQAAFGSGADGDLNVTGTLILDTGVVAPRSQPFAVSFGVLSINNAVVRVDAAAAGLAPGDEVLVINLHGTAAQYASVGRYAFSQVASVSGDQVTLVAPLAVVLGVGSNADLTGQAVVLQRVPNFRDLSVGAGARLTVSDWDGVNGGVLAFRASGTLTVAGTGRVHADAKGYWGGNTGLRDNCDGWQGESYAGRGTGAGAVNCAGGYNGGNGTQAWRRNFGGGGSHITGGGGAHGAGGQAGHSWDGGGQVAPEGGAAYGAANLATMFHGSGGGGVWYGHVANGPQGPGGDGGGLVWVAADRVVVSSGGAIAASGGSSPHWSSGSWTYGAGGGAGGTVYLTAREATLPANSVLAQGGRGEQTHTRHGGNGAVGRVRLDYATLGGAAHGSTAATTGANAASDPDPGFSGGL